MSTLMDDEHQNERLSRRIRRFLQGALPVIHEVGEALDAFTRHVDEVATNAAAIEGTIIESPAQPLPHLRQRLRVHHAHMAIIAAAATYGALRLQR